MLFFEVIMLFFEVIMLFFKVVILVFQVSVLTFIDTETASRAVCEILERTSRRNVYKIS